MAEIRDFYGRIIARVEEKPNGDKVIRDFYNRILGYYVASRDVTTDFYNRVIGQGDCTGMLINSEKNNIERQLFMSSFLPFQYDKIILSYDNEEKLIDGGRIILYSSNPADKKLYKTEIANENYVGRFAKCNKCKSIVAILDAVCSLADASSAVACSG